MNNEIVPKPHNIDLTVLFGFLCAIVYFIVITQFVMYRNDSADFTIALNSAFFEKAVKSIINAIIAFVVLLGGTNAGRSFLKIGYLPDNVGIEGSDIPPWKTTQMLVFTISLIILEVIVISFQYLAGTEKVNFYVEDVSNAMIASILTYVAMRTAPKVAEGVYLQKPADKPAKGEKK
jgi:hypothetical protein